MKLSVNMSKNVYLYHMKENMSGHFDLGSERYTGFFLGSFFYVTYHSGYEWNRRYTNQKNAAMGYVKDAENGCEVRFVRFRGAMCPMQFLQVFLLLETMLLLSLMMNGAFSLESVLFATALGFIFLLICAPIGTFFESLTERSEDGRRSLLSFLMNPQDPYGLYSQIP